MNKYRINILYKGNNKNNSLDRDTTIDIIKGIGIIFMVWGHAAGPFKHWIYLFHMAIFFIASGVLWNDERITNLSGCKSFLLRKFYSLWFPFVLYNTFFNLLHNTFEKTGICSQEYRTIAETLKAIFKNLFFAGGSQFGSATWFLRTLFQLLFVYMLIIYISNKFNARTFFVCISVLICVIGATVVSRYKLNFPLGIHSFFAAFLAFLMGIYINNTGFNKKLSKYKYKVIIISFLALLMLNKIGKVNMSSGNITNVIFFFISSIAGWVMLYSIALCKGIRERKILVYIGQNTLSILGFHLISFKVVTWIYLLLSNGNMQKLSSFPVIKNVPLLWICYTFCGIIIPLILNVIFSMCKRKFHHFTSFLKNKYNYI